MTTRKLGDTITKDFVTLNPSTGAAVDADSTPTAAVYEDDTDTGLSGVTVTKRTGLTGDYRVAIAATAGNGFEVGKSYNVIVSATVDGVAAKACVFSFTLDSKRLADLNDIAAGAAMALTPAYNAAKTAATQTSVDAVKTKTDNLPDDPADESLILAAIGTRLAAADYTAPDNAGIAALPTLAEIEASTVIAKETSLIEAIALLAGYTLSNPTFDARGNMLSGTITTATKSYTITATYDSITGRLLTYEITEA
jgi:hypothetical protein